MASMSIRALVRAASAGAVGVVSALALAAPAAAYQVSGRVTDAGGAAIANVQITFLQSGTATVAASTVAGANGSYAVSLNAGTYDVSLLPPPNGIYSPQLLSGRTISGDTLLDLVLVATTGNLVTVSGTLVDRNGAALDGTGLGARLCLSGCTSTSVNASGAFSLSVVPGNYNLVIEGYSANPALPNYLSLSKGSVAVAGDTSVVVQVQNRTISGVVTGAFGAAANVAISASGAVSSSGLTGSWYDGAVTNGAGAFQVVSISGPSATIAAFPPDGAGGGDASTSVAADNDVSGVQVTLSPLATYTGILRDRNGAPPALASSAVVQLCDRSCRTTTPAADGTFSITSGASSNSWIYINLPLSPGGLTLSINRSVDLAQNVTQTITIPDTLLSGVVRINGSPVSALPFAVGLQGVSFDAFTGSLSGNLLSDANGNYAFAAVPASGPLIVTPQPGYGAGVTTLPLVITGDLSTDLDLNPVVAVQAQVVDRFGAPLPASQNATLCTQSSCSATVSTDAQGAVTFMAGPDSYQLQFSGGFANSADLPWSYSYRRSFVLTQARSEVVVLPNRRLSGSVVDPDGTPVGNVSLSFSNGAQASGDSWQSYGIALTDANGAFAMGTLRGAGSMQGVPPVATGLAPFTIQGVNVDQDLVLGVFLQFVTEQVSANVGAHATVTTDTEGDGATPADPIETSVTTPSAGQVSISEAPIALSPPGHYTFLTQEIDITAPGASTGDPLVLAFRMDASRIPAGQTKDTLQVLRDGRPIENCSFPNSTQAFPDPCVASRQLLADGDVVLTVRSSHASAWTIGYSDQPCSADAQCADQVDCTEDACINGFCAQLPHNEICDDGTFCNGTEQCYPNSGCGLGAAVVCGDDGDPCTTDTTCDEALDTCHVPVVCFDDNNPCTIDQCNSLYGYCGIVLDQVPCDDGDACTPPTSVCNFGYCDAHLSTLADVGCELDSFTADPPCPGLSADLASRLTKKIDRIRARLQRGLQHTDQRHTNHTVIALQKKLYRLMRPANKWFNRGQIADTCYFALMQRVDRAARLTWQFYQY